MAWEVVLLDEVDEWFMGLVGSDPRSAELVTAAIDRLAEAGPLWGVRWWTESWRPDITT